MTLGQKPRISREVPALKQLGYAPFFSEQMAQLPSHLTPARVVGQHRREWDVADEDGTSRATLAGRSWAQEDVGQLDDAQPTVGDWVAIEKSDDDSLPVIVERLERRSSLTRTSAARRGARQTVVANIDWVLIVAAFAHPGTQDAVARRSLHPRRIERFVAAAKKGGAKALVVLNKADLSPEPDREAKKLSKRLKGCPVVTAHNQGDDGLKELLSHLQDGETIGLVGVSGVGKSSILNRILKREAQKIGEERAADARGRHTTTHRELFVSEGGLLLIDTPGMREFALADATEDDLSAFEDIVSIASDCQFRDCGHQKEPGCAVRKAVEDGRLDADRLESFRTLADELKGSERKEPIKRVGRPKRQKYPKRGDKFSWDED